MLENNYTKFSLGFRYRVPTKHRSVLRIPSRNSRWNMEYGKLDFGVKIGSISETEITDIVGIKCLHKVAHGLSFDTKTGDMD